MAVLAIRLQQTLPCTGDCLFQRPADSPTKTALAPVVSLTMVQAACAPLIGSNGAVIGEMGETGEIGEIGVAGSSACSRVSPRLRAPASCRTCKSHLQIAPASLTRTA